MLTGAYKLALMAQASYEPRASHPLLPKFVWNYQTTDYVEIRVEGGTAFVIFRGSDDLIDWIRNADAHLIVVPNGAVHHGMQKGWRDLQAAVSVRLRSLDVDRVVITCHSRGGGIGIQCHEFLYRTRPDLEICTVTFGCPLFCDEDFETWCDDQDMDIVNFINGYWWLPFARDPFPHLPTGFRRPGRDIYLGGMGRPIRMHRIGTYVNRLGS